MNFSSLRPYLDFLGPDPKYTNIRRFYALVGFGTIMYHVGRLMVWLVWAHKFLAAQGY